MDCSKLREIMDLYVDRELSPRPARKPICIFPSAAVPPDVDRCCGCGMRSRAAASVRRYRATPAARPQHRGSPWRVAWRTQAIAAMLLLAAVLSLLSRRFAARLNTLDYMAFHLDDSAGGSGRQCFAVIANCRQAAAIPPCAT
jgi:hypothetical protein